MTSGVMDLLQRGTHAEVMTTTTSSATTYSPHSSAIAHPLARPFLLADALTTSGNGLAYLVAGGWLAGWFTAPESQVRSIGVFLVVFGGGVAVLATRRPIPRRGVLTLVALNAVWVVDSVAYAATGGLSAVGAGWAVLQALVVGGFAAGQLWFARRG